MLSPTELGVSIHLGSVVSLLSSLALFSPSIVSYSELRHVRGRHNMHLEMTMNADIQQGEILSAASQHNPFSFAWKDQLFWESSVCTKPLTNPLI